jgi:hypothetical protein
MMDTPEETARLGAADDSLRVGSLVTWLGKVYRLVGVDPTGVSMRRAYLEDPDTAEHLAVPMLAVSLFDEAG